MRHKLSKHYMIGAGLEIGAGHFPFPIVNPGVSVLYVDRYPRATLLPHFPVATRENIPETDIIANAFKPIPGVLPGKLDFVCNSHCLEHSVRPAEAMDTWLNYLKPGGYLIMAVPDKTECFDRDRALTDWHDLVETPEEAFKLRQYYDWFETIDKLHDSALQERVHHAQLHDEHIHFCVWDYPMFQEFVSQYVKTRGNCTVAEIEKRGAEFFVVLRRT